MRQPRNKRASPVAASVSNHTLASSFAGLGRVEGGGPVSGTAGQDARLYGRRDACRYQFDADCSGCAGLSSVNFGICTGSLTGSAAKAPGSCSRNQLASGVFTGKLKPGLSESGCSLRSE